MNIFLAADRLIIAKRSQIVYLHFSDILFIERFRQKTLVHAHHHEYSIKHSLKEINNLLPDMVVRAHRSFIVCADRCRYDGFLYFRFIPKQHNRHCFLRVCFVRRQYFFICVEQNGFKALALFALHPLESGSLYYWQHRVGRSHDRPFDSRRKSLFALVHFIGLVCFSKKRNELI